MNSDERLAEMMDTWQEARARGADVAPEELCRDSPALLAELSRQVAALQRFDALLVPDDGATGDVGARAETSHGLRPSGDVPSLLGPGEAFGGYRIAALLGEGGMGRVYRATDPVLRREVALKVVKPEIATRDEARERFLREARALAAVEHDHVAAVYQVGEVNGVLFLAMPLLRGETLAARLAREKALPAAEVLRVGREAAAGLAAAHARGLIHRDVKPANIWLEAPPPEASTPRTGGRVKLLDFGLVRLPDEAVTQDGAVLGTPAYMSPEQADGLPVDHRSDLFSLGSVLYECATGQRPFQGRTYSALLTAVAQRRPPDAHEVNPAVPAGLSSIIARLHAKSPDDRPQSARDVVAAICALEGDLDTAPFLKPLPRRAGKPRHLWLRVGAAAVAVVLACAAVAALWPWGTPTPATGGDGLTVGPSPTVAALSARLDVRVWKKGDTSKGLDLGTPGALPLRAGDWMRVEVETNRPAYLYVVYLDAAGEGSPLFPWRKYDWNDSPPPEKVGRLRLPEDPLKDAAPLEPGPSGIEAVLLLARDEPMSAEDVGRL
ncbi:MAG TPA: serine/threonine-protein kinase, partial [Gemmataceae bacterium]|nr:serine/threonine-protein kinase [Gemmataceae bacterium]